MPNKKAQATGPGLKNRRQGQESSVVATARQGQANASDQGAQAKGHGQGLAWISSHGLYTVIQVFFRLPTQTLDLAAGGHGGVQGRPHDAVGGFVDSLACVLDNLAGAGSGG